MDTVVVISDDSSDELNNFIIWNYVFVWSFDMQHTICWTFRVRSIFKLRISKVGFEILNTVECLILDYRIGAKIDWFSPY